jgi:XTP/dITP diphosphohydrolase
MDELMFITSNLHKYEEFSHAIGKTEITPIHYKLKYVEIQADTTDLVAMASATQVASHLSKAFVIEDSGISIDALMGFPGPYSSFVFQTIGNQGIIDLMRDKVNRTASFRSVIVLFDGDRFHKFTGESPGVLTNDQRGNMGFGYDPIFIPYDENGILLDKTYAQLPIELKNKLSHRGKSLEKLIDYLSKE